MSDCDHICTKCDSEPCIEPGPKMAVPRELQTDYEMMVTANLLMAASIESLKHKGEQLETEKAALERRIDELCQENERLRNQLHDQQDTAEHNFVRNVREYKRVCDENAKLRTQLADVTESVGRMEERCAKLRELVRDIYIDMWNYGEWLEPYEQRMRELGIEVYG